ncbi:peptidoglycan DD-metalloendopeptidase family protein [Leeuwenhoekiella sp. A16]|uniref:peptidoglycan DD-metalloendopeptidase family protein n=1 Tax=unclassified Leeuwenhoekiella TaxID=2615029 RepID=UPI003A802262
MKIKNLILLLIGIIFLNACSKLTKATDIFTNPTARELYKRDFVTDTIQFNIWQQAYKNAFADSLSIKLPYLEEGHYYTNSDAVYSYDVKLEQGEVFHLEAATDTTATKVFLELYKKTGDSLNPYQSIAESDLKDKELHYTVENSGDYKVIIQPEIQANTNFALKAYRTPMYHFPVVGKGNAAIQSFWGASRDAGARRHEGLDIFAPRGTPVVAATDGWISSTGNRGLGGKQVWLRAGLWGNSLYYAHLDSIASTQGQRVKTGDTLGFVGNTGNARTTPTHLHFGIYRGRGGAINPLPYVFEGTAPLASTDVKKDIHEKIVVKSSRANLRNSAFAKAKKIGEATRRDTLELLGRSANWLHVRTADAQDAFIHESLVQGI